MARNPAGWAFGDPHDGHPRLDQLRGRIGSPARRIGYYNDRWRAGDACRDSGPGGHEVGEQAEGVSNMYLFWVMQEIRTFARMIASKEQD